MPDDAPDDALSSSPRSDPIDVDPAKEDADTAAAREELKQTAISDSRAESGAAATPDARLAPPGAGDAETVSSPKKKRAHDEVDDGETYEGADSKSEASTDSAKDRALRSQPEAKRLRDEVAEGSQGIDGAKKPREAESAGNKAIQASHAPLISSQSAFEQSGFAKLAATAASPFGGISSSKPSIFGGNSSTQSPFGSLAAAPAPKPAPAPTLSFSSPGQSASASPFASLGPTKPNGFGGAFGGGGSAFGSVFGGSVLAKPLTSFAKPGVEVPKTEKAAKPFGAPDSDAEAGSREDDDDDSDSESEEREKPTSDAEEEIKPVGDDKKKVKLQRVEVDNGEAGEVTLLQVRAKIYHLEKGEGWKERGAGMLKINVPENSVQFDEAGIPIPGSFDASELEESTEDEEEADANKGQKVARLIMRQDNTHRVLLNTAILPAMEFQQKASLKAVGVMFTAFEGDETKPVSVRISAANAKSFLNEVSMIQKELRGI